MVLQQQVNGLDRVFPSGVLAGSLNIASWKTICLIITFTVVSTNFDVEPG